MWCSQKYNIQYSLKLIKQNAMDTLTYSVHLLSTHVIYKSANMFGRGFLVIIIT